MPSTSAASLVKPLTKRNLKRNGWNTISIKTLVMRNFRQNMFLKLERRSMHMKRNITETTMKGRSYQITGENPTLYGEINVITGQCK